MSFDIRLFTPEWMQPLVDIYRRLYPCPRKVREQLIRWRYLDNPFLESPLIAIAVENGQLIATRAAHIFPWRIDGHPETVLVACFGDTIVDKNAEGRWLVGKLTRFLFERALNAGCTLAVNQSPGDLVLKLSLRSGWQAVGPWQLQTRLLETGRPPIPPGEVFLPLDQAQETALDGFTVHTQVPARFAEYAASNSHLPPVRCDRNASFLNWRFRNPFCSYRFITHTDSSGYIALSRKRGDRRVYVADIGARDDAGFEALVEFLVDRLNDAHLVVSATSLPETLDDFLAGHQFRASKVNFLFPNPVVIAPLDNRQGKLTDTLGVDLLAPKNWDASLLNSDAL